MLKFAQYVWWKWEQDPSPMEYLTGTGQKKVIFSAGALEIRDDGYMEVQPLSIFENEADAIAYCMGKNMTVAEDK
jgi:hypothetical protein